MKRFVICERWEQPWFRSLTPRLKALWIYLNDRCDASGVWCQDFELATVYVREPVSESDMTAFGSRVERLNDCEWWLTLFCLEQYNTLSRGCRPHEKVFYLLEKHTLLDRVSDILSDRAQVEEEVEDKVEEEEGGIKGGKRTKHLFKNDRYFEYTAFAAQLPDWPEEERKAYYDAAVDYSAAKGARYLDWIAAVRNWRRKDQHAGVSRIKRTPVRNMI